MVYGVVAYRFKGHPYLENDDPMFQTPLSRAHNLSRNLRETRSIISGGDLMKFWILGATLFLAHELAFADAQWISTWPTPERLR